MKWYQIKIELHSLTIDNRKLIQIKWIVRSLIVDLLNPDIEGFS